MGVIFTPREPSLHARRASSPSVHPCAKHSALEHAVQGLPSEAHGYPADLPGPWRAFWGRRHVGAHLFENMTCHRHHEHLLLSSGENAAEGLLGQRGMAGDHRLCSPWGNSKPKPRSDPGKPILWLQCCVTLPKLAVVYFCMPFCSFPLAEKAWAEMPQDAMKGWGKILRRFWKCWRRTETLYWASLEVLALAGWRGTSHYIF